MDTKTAKLKSQTVQALMIVPFGPIGLFYSNWLLALLLTLVAAVLAGTFLFPMFLTWPLAWVIGFYSVKHHNVLASKFINLRTRKKHAGI